MRYILNKIYILLFVILIFSCGDGNYENVTLEGYVRDNVTKNGIANSKIRVTCWVYDTEVWESIKIEKETFTNKDGFYSIRFDKGEAMDIQVSSSAYKTKNASITLKKNVNMIDFLLSKDTF